MPYLSLHSSQSYPRAALHHLCSLSASSSTRRRSGRHTALHDNGHRRSLTMGEPPSTTSASVFLSTMTGAAIQHPLVLETAATTFLLQPGIPGLEPMPHAASTVERSSRRGDGRRAADDPFFAATGHLFAGTGIYFCCHRPCDLLEPKAPSPPTSVFAGTSESAVLTKKMEKFPRSKSKFNKAIQQNVEQLMDIQSALKAFKELLLQRGTMDTSNKKCNQLSPGEESSTNKEPQVHPTQGADDIGEIYNQFSLSSSVDNKPAQQHARAHRNHRDIPRHIPGELCFM